MSSPPASRLSKGCFKIYLYDMPRRLREYDPALSIRLVGHVYWIVRLAPKTQYLFACLTDDGTPRPPDARDLHRLRASDTWTRSDVFAAIDHHNERLTRSRRREQDDLEDELTRDVRQLVGR